MKKLFLLVVFLLSCSTVYLYAQRIDGGVRVNGTASGLTFQNATFTGTINAITVTTGNVVINGYFVAQSNFGYAFGNSASKDLLLSPVDGEFQILNSVNTLHNEIWSIAPTISGFGGSGPVASVVTGSTSWNWRINVGGTAPGTTGTINLPTATNFWNCWIWDQTTPLDITRQTSSTVSSVSITSTIAWTAGDILIGQCTSS